MNIANRKGTNKWGPAIVACMAIFIIVLDMSAMNVAITNLVTDLDTTLTTIQAIIAMYALIIASFMLIGSKIQDIIGRKKSFLLGISIYGVGTLIASLSVNAGMLLIGWAILEGIGAALMLPATTTIIGVSYEGKDKIKAFGIWGGIAAMGSAVGPIFGGFFTNFVSWRMIFGSEFIVVLIIIFYSYYIKDSKSILKWKEFDYVGAILSVISLIIIVMGLLIFNDPTKWDIIPGVLFIGIALFVIFLYWEKRRIRSNKKPLSDIALLKNRTFSIGIVASVFGQIPLAGYLFIMPVFLQQVTHIDAFMTGVILLPSSIAVMILSLMGVKMTEYIPAKYVVCLGFLISALGTFILGGKFSATMNPYSVIPATIIFGAGVGMILSQLTNYVMSAVDKSKGSDAAGLLNTFKNLGYSMGTALIGVLLIVGVIGGLSISIEDSGLGTNLTKQELNNELLVYVEKMQTGTPEKIPQQYQDDASNLISETISMAMSLIFNILTLIFIVGAAISCVMPRIRISKDSPPGA
ncbi:putative multidrug resistance protein MdtD [bioreactor metagenome]|uniref:Putative multidrug resistance protein MdtD n=1 Tax=bioreactor metagenome TaxID=1076179 RepID=A0A644UZL1_9ZZZZ|nr:MFS transporter [Methanobrevibacter sp.]MEA4957589.1 MFS transporter [Methanobrevibacter sp.]